MMRCFLLIPILFFTTLHLFANVDTVKVSTDSGDPSSLRILVMDANTRPGPDTIIFDLPSPGDIDVSSEIHVTDTLVITGVSALATTLRGGGANRIFWNDSTSLTLEDMTLIDGSANRNGGAIFNDTTSTLFIHDVTFTLNSALNDGGAIYNAGEMTILNSRFFRNAAMDDGGAIFSNELGDVLIRSTVIEENIAFDQGGGISTRGSMEIEDVEILFNLAWDGGGLHNDHSGTLELQEVQLYENQVQHEGGGIYNEEGEVTVNLSRLEGNISALDGGGIENDDIMTVNNSVIADNAADTIGGGIENDGTLNIFNSSIAYNAVFRSGYGGGIENQGDINLVSTIVAMNVANLGGADIYANGGTLSGTNNLIQDTSSTGMIFAGGGNIVNVDPKIVPCGVTCDLLLSDSSPAIDVGMSVASTPSLDLAGRARTQGASIDIGAYEYVPRANSSQDIPTLGEWGLIILSMMLVIVGLVSIRSSGVSDSVNY